MFSDGWALVTCLTRCGLCLKFLVQKLHSNECPSCVKAICRNKLSSRLNSFLQWGQLVSLGLGIFLFMAFRRAFLLSFFIFISSNIFKFFSPFFQSLSMTLPIFILSTSSKGWTLFACSIIYLVSYFDLYGHKPHWYSSPTWTTFTCLCKLRLSVKVASHCSHSHLYFPWVCLMCLVRPFLKNFPHLGQFSILHRCMCDLFCQASSKVFPHLGQSLVLLFLDSFLARSSATFPLKRISSSGSIFSGSFWGDMAELILPLFFENMN